MASFHADRADLLRQGARPADRTPEGYDEVLAPVIAGAYARGVAETLDMLGLPGLFLDASGEVLFVSRAAAPLLNGPLRLHMRHLVAREAADNRLLATFIVDAVGAGTEGAALRLPHAKFELRRLPRTAAATSPDQLVRAVLLVCDEADPRHSALAALLAR